MNSLFLVAIDVREESLELRKYLTSLDAFEIAPQTYLVHGDFHPMDLKMAVERYVRVCDPPRDGIFVVPLGEPRISMNFAPLTTWLSERKL